MARRFVRRPDAAYLGPMGKTTTASQFTSRHEKLAVLEASAASAASLMKMLANRERLILMCRLAEGECSVGDLADYVGLAQTAASQHLAKLRAEGLVATRRDAQTIYYRLDDPAAVRVIDLLCELYRDSPAE